MDLSFHCALTSPSPSHLSGKSHLLTPWTVADLPARLLVQWTSATESVARDLTLSVKTFLVKCKGEGERCRLSSGKIRLAVQ